MKVVVTQSGGLSAGRTRRRLYGPLAGVERVLGCPGATVARDRHPLQDSATHHAAYPTAIRALQPDRLPDRVGHAPCPHNWPAPYWVALAALLGLATLILTVAFPGRDDTPPSGDQRNAIPVVRAPSPVPDRERMHAMQRERVKASLIARPVPAKPAHRH